MCEGGGVALEDSTYKYKLSGFNVLFHGGNDIDFHMHACIRGVFVYHSWHANTQYVSHTSV